MTRNIFLSTLAWVVVLTVNAQTFTSSLVVNIPDAPGPEVYDSVLVSGLPASINSTFGLSGACFNIIHTYDQDLVLRLIAPGGGAILVANRIGSSFDNFTGTCLAENGANGYISYGSAPFTGTWIPPESLNRFNNGQNPNGWWRFAIHDVAGGDIGLINQFSLTFAANPPADPPPLAYPAIHGPRPRIYADSSRLAWLQVNINLPGDCRTTFIDFLYAYNNWWITDPQLYLAGSDSTLWTWDWSSVWAGDEAFYTVFIYKITDDQLALKRCRFLAQQVINCIDTVHFPSMAWDVKEALLRKLSDAGDILLDWCYNYIPGGLRDQLAQRQYSMNREFMNTYILSASGNSYVSSHNTWNNIFCNQNALTLTDASGLSLLQKDTVNQWYRAVYDKLTYGFIPCWTYYRDDDGGWNWGAAYAMWSLMDQFQLFENMRTGTDKNFYTDLPWVENSINQYIYFIQPDNKCIHLGDGETGLACDRTMFLHARIFNDPRSLWMAQKWSQPQYTPNTNQKFAKLLYKDFTMPLVFQPDTPLDWRTDKVGLSVSLSSPDSSATMVTFFNSPSKKAAHEHRDNNSFMIFKNAPLIIDAGYYDYYGGSHYVNYYQRTIAHNSICVFDSTDAYSCFGQPASNDGGQIESAALMNFSDIFLPRNQRGQWIKFASGSNYSYDIADAQLSYDTAKLDFFRRRVLHLKPDKVIILDHVHLKNRTAHQRDIKWVAHFVNKPGISGTLINTEVPGHIETYNGQDYSAANGNGNVAIRTLLPANTATTLIGGIGYEYWVDGNNYLPLVAPDTTYYTPGSWRIEVKPTNMSDTVVYLHTIDIGDAANSSVAGGTAYQNSYSIGTDWNDTLYFFAADADTGKYYHVFTNVAGNRTAGIFAADLLAGSYFVKVDGLVVTTVSADTNGIIQSSAILASGNHTIEIEFDYTIVAESSRNNLLQLYPNPAQAELNIMLKSGTQQGEIEIYNSIGELKIRITDKRMIDVSGLAAGLYLVKVKEGGNRYSAKFIKE
ncbi:MAG: T9SS type A sorting domain-containing protein [Bacteroidetes bacterium]|nr:T9SS type A sorting domain-containing protein [Bacteroidota bacterium]